MRNNASRFGWNYGYSHGPGSGHYDYEGEGSRKTPILSPVGTSSFIYKGKKPQETGGFNNRGTLIASSNLNPSMFDGMGNNNRSQPFNVNDFGNLGDMFMGGNQYQSNPFLIDSCDLGLHLHNKRKAQVHNQSLTDMVLNHNILHQSTLC